MDKVNRMRFLKILVLTLAAFVVLAAPASAQSRPSKVLSATGLNSTVVWTGNAQLRTLLAVNTTSTVYYLKLYAKATAPTCGTDIPLFTLPLGPTYGGVGVPSNVGLSFPAGLGMCLTGGIADNDTTPAAAGVAINFGVSGS